MAARGRLLPRVDLAALELALVAINRDGSEGRWWTAGAEVISRLSAAHRLIAGFEYQNNSRMLQYNRDLTPHLDDVRKSASSGVYVQDEWRLAANAILNAGMRHDRYSTFGGTTSPRFALVVKLEPQTALKLLAGTGESLAGRLQMLDARSMSWTEIRVARDPGCPVCGARHAAA